MTLWLTRLRLTNKRLFKTVSFLVLLALIPLTALALSAVSTSDKGVVTVALAPSGDAAHDPMVRQVITRLKEQTRILRFLEMETEEEAIEAQERGQADAAWIFLPDYAENTAAIAEGRTPVLVRVCTGEDTVFMKLAREKLFAALYPDLSRALFRRYVEEKIGPIPEEDAAYYYERNASGAPLIRFSFADGSAAAEASAIDTDYLLLPLRGMLAILIFAAGAAAAVFYAQDERNGCFTWLSRAQRNGMALFYIGSAVFWTAAVSLLAAYAGGTFTDPGHELLLMLLYAFSVTALTDLLRRILRRAETIATFLPFALVVTLGLCPVFLNVKQFRAASRFLPAFHYLHAVNSASYVRSLLLLAALYAAADLAAAALQLLPSRRR